MNKNKLISVIITSIFLVLSGFALIFVPILGMKIFFGFITGILVIALLEGLGKLERG